MMVMITLRLSSNVDISILCQQSSGLPGSILAKYLRPPSLLSSDQPIRGQHQVMLHCINQSEHSMISVWRLMSSCQHARNPWSCENYGNIKIRTHPLQCWVFQKFCAKKFTTWIWYSCFTGKCKEIGNYFWSSGTLQTLLNEQLDLTLLECLTAGVSITSHNIPYLVFTVKYYLVSASLWYNLQSCYKSIMKIETFHRWEWGEILWFRISPFKSSTKFSH